ncbi:MAG: hypothetical protein M0C28_13290 [Candidatus Moduliflexus flocculans]|nr:hypothetical protein [Candidatus Moduliflexus flocculans]
MLDQARAGRAAEGASPTDGRRARPSSGARWPAAATRSRCSGADDLLVVRARCCNPIRGEKIVGYITRGKGVSVHSVNCPNVTNLLYDPERRIDVEWDKRRRPGRLHRAT